MFPGSLCHFSLFLKQKEGINHILYPLNLVRITGNTFKQYFCPSWNEITKYFHW